MENSKKYRTGVFSIAHHDVQYLKEIEAGGQMAEDINFEIKNLENE